MNDAEFEVWVCEAIEGAVRDDQPQGQLKDELTTYPKFDRRRECGTFEYRPTHEE